jgi:hypothetical protein
MDVAPTVLGLLNLSHDSAFFGRDVLADRQAGNFAPLNHNRDIALYRDERLSTLGLGKTRSTSKYDPLTGRQSPLALDIEGARDAASMFQLAYLLYLRRGYRLD